MPAAAGNIRWPTLALAALGLSAALLSTVNGLDARGRQALSEGRRPIADGRVLARSQSPAVLSEGRRPMAQGERVLSEGRRPTAEGRP